MLRNGVLAVSALALALAGCGSGTDPAAGPTSPATSRPASATGSTEAQAPEAFEAACNRQQTAPRPELVARLPADFPTLTGWQPTQVSEQGRTREVSGVLRGGAADLVSVRDNAVDELTGSGYQRTGTDEEAGYEAEAELEGPQDVAIKVRPLCRDYLVLSYTVRQ